MNDQSFAGDLSGVAMKYKFRSFEDKCKTAELKFKKSLMEQYKILCAVWSAQGITIDPMDIDFTFTRNYPQNLTEEIDFLTKAKGIITEETAFANVSFIENPKEEIEKLDEQKQEDMDQFLATGGAIQTAQNTDTQKEPVKDDSSANTK
jgi:SPP1 family phage portal protein